MCSTPIRSRFRSAEWDRSRSPTSIRRTIRGRNRSAQFGDRQAVGLGAIPDRFLASGEGLGDGPDAHALAGEQVELLDFVLTPGLAMALELLSAGHCYLTRSTCSNSSSTGVARPKIDTDTLTRPRSKSSSSTTPLKLANGPSRTFTASPIS